MSYLHIAALVAVPLSTGLIGIAIGCAIDGDRKETGLLSMGLGGVAATCAVVFWLL